MESNSGVPERIGVDFAREYCSLVLPHMNCGPRIYDQSPYDYWVALPTAGLPRISRPSSGNLGWFDDWPIELLTEILESMDFKSLLTFSRVSVQAYNVVHALSAYQEVMEHAKRALPVLGATGLLAHHAASSLRRALRSPRCAVCSGFGAFLFLPTCQRACGHCLRQEATFQVASPELVEELFSLMKEQLGSIPELQLLPDIYAINRQEMEVFTMCISNSMVSVRQVHDLAAQLGDGPKAAASWEPKSDVEQVIENYRRGHCWGPSYIRFPFIDAAGGVEHGRWCRGCLRTRSDFSLGKLPEQVREELSEHAVDGCVATHITTMAARLWSERELMEHVTHCYGARVLSRRWHGVHQEMQRRGFRPRSMAPARHIAITPDLSSLRRTNTATHEIAKRMASIIGDYNQWMMRQLRLDDTRDLVQFFIPRLDDEYPEH